MPKKQQKTHKKLVASRRRSRLWRWFIPGMHNAHRPTLVRWRGTAVVAALLVALQLVYNATAVGQLQILGYATNISAGEVISLMNNERASSGMSGLSYNSQLTNSATAKAQDMFEDDYWAHVAPDGKGPDYFIQQAGYSYARAGENLAKRFQTSSGVVSGWMGSQGHKDNILGDYREVGVAVVNGTLQGEETTLVVAHYGKPSESSPTPKPTPKPTPTPSPAPESKPAPQTIITKPDATPKQETLDKDTVDKTEKETETTEKDEDNDNDNEDSVAIGVAATPGGSSTPATLGFTQKVGIVLTSNWAATVSLVVLVALLAVSVVSHHQAWLHQIRKHGIKLHWPTHIHHGAHVALVVVGISLVVAGVVGTVL